MKHSAFLAYMTFTLALVIVSWFLNDLATFVVGIACFWVGNWHRYLHTKGVLR